MNYSMKKKRIMSMLVVLTMAMSFILPTTVFAATPVASDAVATVLKGNGVELVKQITVSFDSEIKFDGADFTDANVTVDNGHSFGESTAIVDENDATKLVIKLADDATVEVGDTITFENSVILDKATETDAFNGSVNISGDLTGAEVNFDVPAGVTVTVEGESAPSYYGIGTYSYKAEGEGFEEVEDTFEVTEGDFATPKNIDVSISKLEAIGFTATAVATNVTANYGKADKIVLVFGEAIEAEASAILAQLSIEDYISNAEFDTTKTILTLTIDQTVTPALTNGTKISYAKNSANKTVSGKIMDAVADVEISGNLVGAEDQIGYMPGSIYCTKGYNLKCKCIIHAVTMWLPGTFSTMGTVRKLLLKIIAEAKKRNMRSIAIPLLGTGVGHLNHDKIMKLYEDTFSNEAEIEIYVYML